MLDQLLIASLFFALVISLIMTSWSAVWVFAGAMLIAYFLGLVDTAEVLAKATNSGLITLILLLLVSIGLEKLSWLTRLSGKLITPGYYASLLRMGFFTALFSAFVNNTAVVAALAHTVRSNRHHPASKLLLPLSYAAILGGTVTLIGTSTNLIVSSFLEDATGQGLAFGDFLWVGLAVTAAGLFVILASSALLPSGNTQQIDINEYLIEAEVDADSDLVGKSILANGLREMEDLFLVEIVRGPHLISPVAPQEYIEAGDKLIFSGDIKQLNILESIDGLRLFAVEEGLLSAKHDDRSDSHARRHHRGQDCQGQRIPLPVRRRRGRHAPRRQAPVRKAGQYHNPGRGQYGARGGAGLSMSAKTSTRISW